MTGLKKKRGVALGGGLKSKQERVLRMHHKAADWGKVHLGVAGVILTLVIVTREFPVLFLTENVI